MTTTAQQDAKKYYIRTYGCQMNELDTEVMAGVLERRGLAKTENEEDADVLIFNTCSIRDLAERKVMGKLGKLGRTRHRNKIIGVTGCMANAKKDKLFHKLPHIDFVLGTNNIHELDEVLDQVQTQGLRMAKTDSTFTTELDYVGASRADGVKAFVSIIRGCDKYCTYCVVPYTRGPEVSRAPESIEDEVRALVAKGTREVMLLGQNVNSYGKDQREWGTLFHDLLYRLDKIEGLERIRFMTSHPVDITRELMIAIRDLPSVCDFVHFPLQAGSSRVLKKMHRIYTKEQYFEKVAMLKELVPNVALGTDIIVGFPTETDEEFEETYQAMKEIEYSAAFIFAYSARQGTPAMRWKDDVPEEVKQERLHRLLDLQKEITGRQRQEFLGQEVEVLVEGVNKRNANVVNGRTTCWRKVSFPGSQADVGTLRRVNITGFHHETMLGEGV